MSRIKHILQRIFRRHHTSDFDLMYLDVHLARIIAKKLKVFRNQEPKTVPIELYDKYGSNAKHEWLKIIDKMIAAFEAVAAINNNVDPKEIQTGINLFAKYFQSLWNGAEL